MSLKTLMPYKPQDSPHRQRELLHSTFWPLDQRRYVTLSSMTGGLIVTLAFSIPLRRDTVWKGAKRAVPPGQD